MTNVGESSQAREEGPQVPIEEVPRDIQVVWEQLLPWELAHVVTVVEDEDDDVETDEEDPVELPQEDEEEETPLTSIVVRMYDKVYDRNMELQDIIEELQEIVVEQQTTMTHKDDEIQDCEERLTNVEEELVQTEGEKEQLIEVIAELKNKLKEEATKRARAEDAYEEAFQRTRLVARDAQAKRMKMEEMDKVFNTMINRAQDRVMGYPIQFETLPSYVLDRRTMFRVMEEERRKATEYLNRTSQGMYMINKNVK